MVLKKIEDDFVQDGKVVELKDINKMVYKVNVQMKVNMVFEDMVTDVIIKKVKNDMVLNVNQDTKVFDLKEDIIITKEIIIQDFYVIINVKTISVVGQEKVND